MFNHKSKRPSLLYIECKSRDISRRNSQLCDNFDDTINKQNTYQQQRQLSSTTKKTDLHSLNNMYKQAIFDQQISQDQTEMLIEDLNGKLLQRAELIGQIEELEELLDYHKKHSSFEIEFAIKIEKLDRLIQQQQKSTKNTSELFRQKELYYHELNKLANQEALKAFAMYLKQWGQQFEIIKNNYGPEIYQQLIVEKQQEFIENLTVSYDKKIKGIIQLFRNYQLLEIQMQNNINFVDNILNQELINIKQSIKQNQELIQKILRIHLDQGISSNLNEKMQNLELKNIKLAQKLNQIAQSQQFAQDNIKIKKQSEEYNNEFITGFGDISQIENDELKNEWSNSQSKQKVRYNNFKSTNKDSQQKMNVLQQTCQTNNLDMDNKFSDYQCNSEDSTLQHFQEINLALIQSIKSNDSHVSRPTQQQLTNQDKLLSQQNLFFRLQTITEEQLSSKRNRQNVDQRINLDTSSVTQNNKTILNFKKIKQLDNSSQYIGIPLTDQTKRFSNSEQSENQLKDDIDVVSKQKFNPSTNGSSISGYQCQIPTSNSKNKIDNIFKSKEKDKSTLSEKLSKQKKSKSFDSTSNKEQLKQFISNTSNNSGQSKDLQQTQNFLNQLMPIEQEILKILKPLQKGYQIYKRYSSTKPNLTKQEFDPFNSQNPASLGFCPRIICLSKKLDSIEFKNQMKVNQVDASIKLEEIMRVIISSSIQQCIQIKKQIQCKYILSKQESTVCKISFWPMSLITQNDGRIELLFSNEQVLEQWQANLIFLKDNIKTLQAINKKLNQ